MKMILIKLSLSQFILCSLTVAGTKDTGKVAELKARQGILEYPKQIATIIRNRISESVDRVFPTPGPNQDPTHTQPLTPAPITPRSTRAPAQPKPTLPGDTALGQYIVDNYVITSTSQAPLPPYPMEIDAQLSPEVESIPVTPRPSVGAAARPPSPASVPLSPAEVEEYIYLLGVPSTPRQPQEVRVTEAFEPEVTPDPEDFDPGTPTVTASVIDVDVDVDVDETTAVLPVTEDVDIDVDSEVSTTEEATTSDTEIDAGVRQLLNDLDVFELFNE